MSGRRPLLAIALLAAALHAIGVARTLLPAQDGLKFLRVARQFQAGPWTDVVRNSDQHPLYPALIALAEPVVSALTGDAGPETWRIAAQAVSALAAILLIVPLYGLTRALFDERIARLAALIYVLLPLPAAIGHDTLSDSLALLGALTALRLGEAALRSGGWPAALGCGIAAGLGFLARPEVAIVPVAVLATALVARRHSGLSPARREGLVALGALALSFLTVVGYYAVIKGDLSEKLALRHGAALGPNRVGLRRGGQLVPRGLDDPRWDFSPKEEAEEPDSASAGAVAGRLALQWAEGLCGLFAIFAAWGVARDRFIRGVIADEPGAVRSAVGRWLLAVYLALFSLVLARHVIKLGYLSDRHTLTLVVASLPWAAAGTFICARGVAIQLGWGAARARRWGVLGVLVLVAAGVIAQCEKPPHPSRWGHWAAGRCKPSIGS